MSERRIWKYPIVLSDEFVLSMPAGSKILDIQTQRGEPVLWALVDPSAKTRERRFNIVGSGHPISDADDLSYVGTFQMGAGAWVWHLFEVKA